MCGIAGLVDLGAEHDEGWLLATAGAMASTLRHRGPDDAGTWADPSAGVALGFRRLAIIDLSPAGHQPMASADGRYVVVFNGEIYNHHQLKAELTGIPFRGRSDTEVMLGAFMRWGVAEATRRFNGMFAFAVWDRQRRTLTLGRDRFGEKPLYYGTVAGRVLFGSELKALRAVPGPTPDLDRDALALFLRHGYIPAPHSIYQGIAKLAPAHLVEIGADGIGIPTPYWSAREAAEAGLADPLAGGEGDLVDELEELLGDAVALRMEADVPLGAFLSGGIDSSLVVALMQRRAREPVRTFTIGFAEEGYDEAPHAKAVAGHLGTDHTELYVSPEEARAVIPTLPTTYDEPFSDSSQIPTALVSALARDHVTVSLSGDGGDELFGGYSRYLLLAELWGKLERLPLPLRATVARAVQAVPARRWDAVFRAARPALPRRARQSHPGDKLHKLAASAARSRPEDVYLGLVSLWHDPGAMVIGGSEPVTPITDPAATLASGDPTAQAMYLDTVTYLPDDILAKVDRASMSVSLEARVPLLDHRVFELAWRLPPGLRVVGGDGKHLLRRVLARHVPTELFDRPKMGFGVPIGVWLRGPLRAWAEDLLDEGRLRRQGILDPAPVRAAWHAHLAGTADEKYRLWAVLSLQAWLAEVAS